MKKPENNMFAHNEPFEAEDYTNALPTQLDCLFFYVMMVVLGPLCLAIEAFDWVRARRRRLLGVALGIYAVNWYAEHAPTLLFLW